MSAEADRAFAVLTDARFWQAEWVHFGHMSECPNVEPDGGPCRRFRIGLKVEVGRVRWLEAPTVAEAFRDAALVLFDGVRIQSLAGYAG